MSLDVYLTAENPFPQTGSRIFIRDGGQMKQISREEWNRRFPDKEPVTVEADEDSDRVYRGNITHNLGGMADAAGIYNYLWRPDELGVTRAKELIEPLAAGLARLRAEPDKFRAHNPKNGWGDYEGLVAFVEEYLLACKAYPSAAVSVWR